MDLETLRSRAAGLLLSLLIFFAAGEIGVRLYARGHLVYDLEMARYARQLKVDAPTAAIGHVHAPNRSAHLMGVDVRINADGLRDRDYPVERSSRYRMIFLGDSLTFGWGVRQEEIFENLLEQTINRIRPVEVLNFGSGNYNTSQETQLFIERGVKYRPDKVVLFYFINDAEPASSVTRWSILERSEFVSFSWSRFHTIARRLSSTADYKEYYASLYRAGARGWDDAKAALVLLRNVCRDRGIQLQVVLLPELHAIHPYAFTREHGVVSAFLAEQHIDHLDLAPSFESAGEPSRLWVAADDAHPNAAAHRLIAQYARDFVSPKD